MIERRAPLPDSAQGYLTALPALILLNRLPVATLAVRYDGSIVYANPAFEHMLGYDSGTLADQPIDAVLDDRPPRVAGSVLICGHSGRLISLRHRDASIVRTVASESVMMRKDDPLALVVFHDITEQLWTAGES